MAHVIQLALGVFISSLGVKGPTKSLEAHEGDYQFGVNKKIDNGNSPLLRKERNTRITNVTAKRPGYGKIIEIVCIWRNSESFIVDHHQVEIV